MPPITGFPPVCAPDARILILGSMPGEASLQAQQYYAHPRNQFWPIITRLLKAGPDLPYAERTALLRTNRIALWDVLQSCTRKGSLDSAIQAEQANDFAAFFKKQNSISHIFFNGRKAEASFRRLVQPAIVCTAKCRTLPSTSPANATCSLERKYEIWKSELGMSDILGVKYEGDDSDSPATAVSSATTARRSCTGAKSAGNPVVPVPRQRRT